MKPLPFRITIYNRAANRTLGHYWAAQVPAKGDLVYYAAETQIDDDPFQHWGVWQVDSVIWKIAHRDSPAARDLALEAAAPAGTAFCTLAEIHVFPARGPHFDETPRWAKAASPPSEDEGNR